jgi:hypothetical protein
MRAGFVYAPSRRLADDHQLRAGAHEEHGLWPERQMRCADAARARFGGHGVQEALRHAHL